MKTLQMVRVNEKTVLNVSIRKRLVFKDNLFSAGILLYVKFNTGQCII